MRHKKVMRAHDLVNRIKDFHVELSEVYANRMDSALCSASTRKQHLIFGAS